MQAQYSTEAFQRSAASTSAQDAVMGYVRPCQINHDVDTDLALLDRQSHLTCWLLAASKISQSLHGTCRAMLPDFPPQSDGLVLAHSLKIDCSEHTRINRQLLSLLSHMLCCRKLALDGCSTSCPRPEQGAAAQLCRGPDCSAYGSTVDGMRKIIRREGVLALWRGTDVALLMAIPTVSCPPSIGDTVLLHVA